jgi:hypothetical protein
VKGLEKIKGKLGTKEFISLWESLSPDGEFIQ